MKAQNTIEQKLQMDLFAIANQMQQAGLPSEFIVPAVHTASEFEGVYDLMKLWQETDDSDERKEIVADIQDMIDDCQQKEKIEAVYVRFDDLETIVKDVRRFKDTLREVVDQKGGITQLAELTGIPQSSLSRFFNSASRPRRTTLYRIAKALNLSEIEITNEWSE